MPEDLMSLTTKVVAAYLSNNTVPQEQVGSVIKEVYEALQKVGTPQEAVEPPVPAVPVKKSVSPDHITCLECGRKLKMLKRHVESDHGMSVAEYRAKWGLPSDYPVVAPNYARLRSEHAQRIGLGKKGGKAE
jgi:predicted transcriptional regulator